MKYTIIFIVCIMFSSCIDKQANVIITSYDYELVPQENGQLSYPLDEDSRYYIKALFPYVDNEGKSYLTFQNKTENEILFYDMYSSSFLFKLRIDIDGPNGAGKFVGYTIKDLNEIYLTSIWKKELIKVDTTQTVLEKIKFEKSDTDKRLGITTSLSFCYTPIVFFDDYIYVTQDINRSFPFDKSPVSIRINKQNNKIETLPIYFPKIMSQSEIKEKALGHEFNYSRCFNDSLFIYSFFFDENIYIANPSHDNIKKIAIKSKYIGQFHEFKKRPADMDVALKKMCEMPMYGNLIYDEYRQVYYRFAYPESKIDTPENYRDIWECGRNIFSIIILDKNFNIIGESIFPEFIYMSTLYFINKDGLYISNSHYKNPAFDENSLSFVRFDLIKK